MKSFLIIALLLFSLGSYGQPKISVEVSADTIEIGKTVEVKYTIQNGNGKFILPVLDSLPVISGPNSSSSFMYQNGEQSSSQSYSFTLAGLEEGILTIPDAKYITGEESIVIDALEVIVVVSMSQPTVSSKNKSVDTTSKSKREKRVF